MKLKPGGADLAADISDVASTLAGFGAAAAMPLLGLVIPLKILVPSWTLIGIVAGTALLGSDPRTRLNDDLERLKGVLEASVRREAHGQEPRS